MILSRNELKSARSREAMARTAQEQAIDIKCRDLRKPNYMHCNLSLRKFGRLIVIDCLGIDKWRETWWRVGCPCGNIGAVRGKQLKNGTVERLKCCKRQEGL